MLRLWGLQASCARARAGAAQGEHVAAVCGRRGAGAAWGCLGCGACRPLVLARAQVLPKGSTSPLYVDSATPET